MAGRKKKGKTAVVSEDTSLRLLDEWLRIELEHTDPGFILPDRAALVTWSENHAVPVLVIAGFAVWAPVIGGICFG